MLAVLRDRTAEMPFHFISTPNAQHVLYLQRGNAAYTRAHDMAWLTPCDSRVLIRLARLMFGIRLHLVAGSDLTASLFATVIDRHEPITVIGGDPTLEALLRTKLGLTRLALYDPPMGFVRDEAEIHRAAAFVEANPARFIFLACGAPQSDILGSVIAARGQAKGLGLCIGASLKFVTGQVRRAPRLFQLAGLEWLYRLLQEPRRLGRRFMFEQLPILAIAVRFRLSPRLCADHSQRGQWPFRWSLLWR